MKILRNKKNAFTHLVKALRSNRSSAKLAQSPSRFSLGFAPCSESFAVEPSVQACSISSLSGIHFRSFRPQIRSLTGLRFARPSAFTLAEVLITLTILGVIAAITVPSLVRKIQDKQTVTTVKKVYAMLDDALSQMVTIDGPINVWATDAEVFTIKLAQYLNAEYCGYTCYPQYYGPARSDYLNARFRSLNGQDNVYWVNRAFYPSIKLKNDIRIRVLSVNGCADGANYCWGVYGSMLVDINGRKGPNKYGYDVFLFPFGPRDGLLLKYRQSTAFYNNCKSPSEYGTSCLAWVIKHGNLDYKYRDVSAEW